MYRITDEQVDYILNDIKQRGIEIADLQQNLLDHICCIIERQLDENGDFKACYQKIIEAFYKERLAEIEEETILLLTFKNYYGMKKLMIVSGILCTTGFFIGSFFKIMHWNGTYWFLIPSIIFFSFVFLPLLFLLKTKEASSQREKLIVAVGCIVGVLYCLSTLFLVEYWHGASVLWSITLLTATFVLLPLYFFNGIRKPETKLNTIVTTFILIGLLGMQFTLTSLHKHPQKHTVVNNK
ncbi:hypothetical protein CAP35_14495 [Chitinophagaceae bacterium IBVUCB1]|nr:hypothetical protein CAP35_14495 [Chitinophagaceae bacterium IBVUCB1]